MYKKVSAEVNEQIFRDLQNAYERALTEESVVLSRAERNRMLSQIMKMVGRYDQKTR